MKGLLWEVFVAVAEIAGTILLFAILMLMTSLALMEFCGVEL